MLDHIARRGEWQRWFLQDRSLAVRSREHRSCMGLFPNAATPGRGHNWSCNGSDMQRLRDAVLLQRASRNLHAHSSTVPSSQLPTSGEYQRYNELATRNFHICSVDRQHGRPSIDFPTKKIFFNPNPQLSPIPAHLKWNSSLQRDQCSYYTIMYTR
jgi:hypothetical protein